MFYAKVVNLSKHVNIRFGVWKIEAAYPTNFTTTAVAEFEVKEYGTHHLTVKCNIWIIVFVVLDVVTHGKTFSVSQYYPASQSVSSQTQTLSAQQTLGPLQ